MRNMVAGRTAGCAQLELQSYLDWQTHGAAALKAKASGACWQCCQELGCRATDRPGDTRELRKLHVWCSKKIGVRGPSDDVTTTKQG